jgi:hypothetical protein
MCCLLVAVNYYDYRNFNCVDCCSPVQAIFVYQHPFDYGSETGCRPYVHSFVECHVCSEVSVTVELIHSRYVPLSQCVVYVSADRCWYAVRAAATSIVTWLLLERSTPRSVMHRVKRSAHVCVPIPKRNIKLQFHNSSCCHPCH